MSRRACFLLLLSLAICWQVGTPTQIRAQAKAKKASAKHLAVTNNKIVVCMQPLGRYNKHLLRASVRGIKYIYGFDVRVLPKQKMPKRVYYKPRRRWRADKILDHYKATAWPKLKAKGCTFWMGFTGVDISTTTETKKDWGILGLAEIKGVVGVVSTYRTGRRLNKPHTRARRTVKVINHEIGHLLGIPHIKGTGCLMNSAEGSVLTTDKESGLLCTSSVNWIERQWGVTIPRHKKVNWSLIERKK